MSKPISILHRTIMKAVKKPTKNSTITNNPRADLAAPENEIYSVVYPEEFNPRLDVQRHVFLVPRPSHSGHVPHLIVDTVL